LTALKKMPYTDKTQKHKHTHKRTLISVTETQSWSTVWHWLIKKGHYTRS